MSRQHPPRMKNLGDGDFFFFIEGLPPYYTWGMLKDLTRKAAPFPGWTEMATNPQGMQKGLGWIKIRRPADAFNLYSFLTTGSPSLKPLKVYLWLTVRSPPELLRCNCEPPRSMQAVQPPSYPPSIYSTSMDTPTSITMDAPMSTPMSTLMRNTPMQQRPVSHHRPPVAPKKMKPTYVYTQNHQPINATGGLVQTESRSIFISQLDYAVEQRQLEEYLRRIGSFDSCEIRRDPATGRSRGIATARFANAKAAARAIPMLQGQKLLSKTIRVRFDRDKETVAPATLAKPAYDDLIIANGSQ